MRAWRPVRRCTTGTSAASCCTSGLPKRRTPPRTPRSWRRPSTTGGSCWPVRCCRPSRTRPASCSSTRSTGPTTSSRPSSSRSCPTSPSRSRSWGPSVRRRRRSARRPPAPPPSPPPPAPPGGPHAPLKRRCLYHWLQHPEFDREVAILRRRLPQVTEQLAREVARASARLRTLDLLKPPGFAESMDWATALHTLGARDLDPDLAARTLGAVLKYREDTDRVHALARGALFGG